MLYGMETVAAIIQNLRLTSVFSVFYASLNRIGLILFPNHPLASKSI